MQFAQKKNLKKFTDAIFAAQDAMQDAFTAFYAALSAANADFIYQAKGDGIALSPIEGFTAIAKDLAKIEKDTENVDELLTQLIRKIEEENSKMYDEVMQMSEKQDQADQQDQDQSQDQE